MVSKYTRVCGSISAVTSLKLIYDDGELRISGLDRNRAPAVEVRFRDALVTQISEEGTRIRLLQELGTERGLVVRVESSALIRWLAEEGLHTRALDDAKHFIVLAGEEVVDVLSMSDPDVRVMS